MPVAVARLTHDIDFIFCDTTRPSFLHSTPVRFVLLCVVSTNTIVPRSATKAVQTSPINPSAAAARAQSLRDRFPLPANVTAFLHAARNLSWLAG